MENFADFHGQADLFSSAESTQMHSQKELVAICAEIIGKFSALSSAEAALVEKASKSKALLKELESFRESISAGCDPLGELFQAIRSAEERREVGAVYTPRPIVQSMLAWISNRCSPSRVVDPGAGSGRFLLAAGELFPHAQLVAVEKDPLAALMLRANLVVRGWMNRSIVLVEDYRNIKLDQCAGVTAFVGNPPYVRHHNISNTWKKWYSEEFARLGIKASALAGLHLHFFLQTSLLAKKGDIGAFITSAEWMDVNYGAALRRLLIEQLGGISLHVLTPTVEAFPGTATTAAITCFQMGVLRKVVKIREVASLDHLNGLTKGVSVPRSQFQTISRWSIIVRPSTTGTGDVELGEVFKVHRGQVTGANGVWIAGAQSHRLPNRVKLAAVTRAKDLILAGEKLDSSDSLRRVVDLPADLDDFSREEKRLIDEFLSWARLSGADQGYVARHRRAWWSVGLKEAAPILCTYMARRPPQFTLNACNARHINIAHGLYPMEPIEAGTLTRLVAWLNSNVQTANGRTYAGGLTKFEPREVERIRIPRLENFAE